MNYQITATTDGKYLGHFVEMSKRGPVLPADMPEIQIETIMPIEGGFRLINSNYVIDVKEL